MAAINLQSFFRFAVDHMQLVDELYARPDGVSEAELMTLIRRVGEAEAPGAAYVRDRLLELGFIAPAPHAEAQFEMSRPVADLLRYLKREYLLTSPEVLRGVMTALEGYARELDQAVEQGDADLSCGWRWKFPGMARSFGGSRAPTGRK